MNVARHLKEGDFRGAVTELKDHWKTVAGLSLITLAFIVASCGPQVVDRIIHPTQPPLPEPFPASLKLEAPNETQLLQRFADRFSPDSPNHGPLVLNSESVAAADAIELTTPDKTMTIVVAPAVDAGSVRIADATYWVAEPDSSFQRVSQKTDSGYIIYAISDGQALLRMHQVSIDEAEQLTDEQLLQALNLQIMGRNGQWYGAQINRDQFDQLFPEARKVNAAPVQLPTKTSTPEPSPTFTVTPMPTPTHEFTPTPDNRIFVTDYLGLGEAVIEPIQLPDIPDITDQVLANRELYSPYTGIHLEIEKGKGYTIGKSYLGELSLRNLKPTGIKEMKKITLANSGETFYETVLKFVFFTSGGKSGILELPVRSSFGDNTGLVQVDPSTIYDHFRIGTDTKPYSVKLNNVPDINMFRLEDLIKISLNPNARFSNAGFGGMRFTVNDAIRIMSISKNGENVKFPDGSIVLNSMGETS